MQVETILNNRQSPLYIWPLRYGIIHKLDICGYLSFLLIWGFQAKCLNSGSVLKGNFQPNSLIDSFLEFFGVFWWYLQRVLADTWPLGTFLIFHNSHQSNIRVTYHSYHSPTIREKYILAPLWNLFRLYPDYMCLFCCIHDSFDLLMLTALFFCTVTVCYSRDFGIKKTNRKQGCKKWTLEGSHPNCYRQRCKLQKSKCDKILAITSSSLHFSCYLWFIICKIKNRWKKQVAEKWLLYSLVVLTNLARHLSHHLTSPVQPWPILVDTNPQLESTCHGVIRKFWFTCIPPKRCIL